jgi:hypothetical protein
MVTAKPRGIWAWDLVKWIIALSIFLYASFFIFLGFTETANRCAIAWSSKISFICFCMAFSASAVHQKLKNSLSFWHLMNRRYFGIAFAISHLFHLAFLLILQQVFHPVFNLAAGISLFSGGMAYLFTVLMLFTSFDAFSKYLSKKQWKWLHTIGGYWILLIFLSTYLKKVKNVGVEFIPFVLILILTLLLRIQLVLKKNNSST